MQDIRVDGRTQRVFVLKESDERIVYIPIKSLHRVDYDRLLDIEKASAPGKMLDLMLKTTLNNGRNALVQYDSIIQVMFKTDEKNGVRLRKPTESLEKQKAEQKKVQVKTSDESDEATELSVSTVTPKPRGRGRPPKQKEQ